MATFSTAPHTAHSETHSHNIRYSSLRIWLSHRLRLANRQLANEGTSLADSSCPPTLLKHQDEMPAHLSCKTYLAAYLAAYLGAYLAV